MLTLFIISLIILVALFWLKLAELKVGKRILLPNLRQRGDKLVSSFYQQIKDGLYQTFNKVGYFSNQSLRHRLSSFFAWLSRQLRK